MEKDHNMEPFVKAILWKTDSVVRLLLVLEAVDTFPANVMKQEDHPNEVKWQKTQT